MSLDEFARRTQGPEVRPVQPVEVNISAPSRQTPASGEPLATETAVLWPDIQAAFSRDMRTGALTPTHDREALDVALQITTYLNPDRVVFLGDNLDLPDWSLKFLRSPEFYWSTQAAAVEIAWWLGQVRAECGDAGIDYIEGNHEFRMSNAIQANLVASYGLSPVDDVNGPALLSIERLLGMASMDITYHGPYPDGEVLLNKSLRIHHGEVVRSKSGGTVRAVIDDINHSEGQGHIHRLELASKTTWNIDEETAHVNIAFSPGTLCRIKPGLVPGARNKRNWQQGIAVVEYSTDNKVRTPHVDLVPIVNGTAIYDGIVWRARKPKEILAHIERDTNYKVS